MLRWLGAPLQACFPALRRSGSSRNTMEPGTGPAPALPPRMQTEPGTGPAPSPAADSAKVLVEDAVFQLYAPAGEPAMDVVFFHGLQLGDYSKAWLTSWQADTDKPDGCWPSRLLAKDFPHARILSVAYDSSARGGNMDLFAIREQLAVLLMSAGVGKRPVAFVGHSLGGLVLKEVCNELHKQAQESPKHKQALGSVVGMAFYATPHAGSRLADAGLVKVFGSGAVMTYLRTLDTDAARLNGDFGKLKERQGWSTLGFGETMPTVKGPFGAVVVEEASARQQMDTFLQVPKSDHNTVCKPPTETAASYVTLKQYLDTQFNKRTKEVVGELKAYQQVDTGKLFGREGDLQAVCNALKSSGLGIITGGPGEGKSELAYAAAIACSSKLRFTKVINVNLGATRWTEFDDKSVALDELAKRLNLSSWTKVNQLRPTPVVLYHNTEDILSRRDSSAEQAFYKLVGTLHSFGDDEQPRAYQIITSRIAPAVDQLPLSSPTPVSLDGGLKIDAACELLLAVGGAAIERSQAKGIVGICEGNPLLLQLLGGSLKSGEVTTQEIIDVGIRANQCDDGVHHKVDTVSVFLTFLLKRRPEQLNWVAEMSLWDSFSKQQASTAAELATPRLLDHMARVSILQRTGQEPHVRYSMHVLVREAAAKLLKDQGGLLLAAQERLVRAMAAVGDRVRGADASNAMATRLLLTPELGNCRRLCAVSPTLVQDDFIVFSLENLFNQLSRCGFYSEAASVVRQVYDALLSVMGAAHLGTLGSMTNLGSTLRQQSKYAQAEELHRKALAGCLSELDDLHPTTLACIANLGNTLQERGKHAEAEELLRDGIAKCRSKLGDLHLTTLGSINNLGITLQEQAKHAEAEELHREAHAGYRSVLGASHTSTLGSINNLGVTLREQGKHAEAEEVQREALAGCRSELDDSHPYTLASIINLGDTLQEQGKLAEAEVLQREALAGVQSVLGDTHLHTLGAMTHLGITLQEQGKHAEAEKLQREALARCRSVLGDVHTATLSSICCLGDTLQEQGKHAEAEELHREALAGCWSVLGNSHPHTLASISSLGITLREQGKHSEAEELQREALAGCLSELGDSHPQTLASFTELGNTLRLRGKHAEAEALLSKARSSP